MTTTYEIRSRSGNAIMAFDNEERARKARDERSRKINAPLRLFEVQRIEREL